MCPGAVSGYVVDPSTGRVDFEGGGYAFRLVGPGVVMIWNKKSKCEVPLTVLDIERLWSEMRVVIPSGEKDSA